MKAFILALLVLSAVSATQNRRRLAAPATSRRTSIVDQMKKVAAKVNAVFMAEEKAFAACLKTKGAAEFKAAASAMAKVLLQQAAAKVMAKITGGRRMSMFGDLKKKASGVAKKVGGAVKAAACGAFKSQMISGCVAAGAKGMAALTCPTGDTNTAKVCPHFQFVKDCANAQVKGVCDKAVTQACA